MLAEEPFYLFSLKTQYQHKSYGEEAMLLPCTTLSINLSICQCHKINSPPKIQKETA